MNTLVGNEINETVVNVHYLLLILPFPYRRTKQRTSQTTRSHKNLLQTSTETGQGVEGEGEVQEGEAEVVGEMDS